MPTSIQWWSGGGSAFDPAPSVGQGGVIGMPRPDGITDGFNTIQGSRTYDPQLGGWTTPDAYSGNVHDPASQKSYLWNGNNPIAYSDPSGYYSAAYDSLRGGSGWYYVPQVAVEEGSDDGSSTAPLTGTLQQHCPDHHCDSSLWAGMDAAAGMTNIGDTLEKSAGIYHHIASGEKDKSYFYYVPVDPGGTSEVSRGNYSRLNNGDAFVEQWHSHPAGSGATSLSGHGQTMRDFKDSFGFYPPIITTVIQGQTWVQYWDPQKNDAGPGHQICSSGFFSGGHAC